MSELSRITEELLEQARHGHDPESAQVEQTLDALHERLEFCGEAARPRRVAAAAAAALAADAVVASSSKAASALTGKVILKLVIAGVALGGSVTTAVVVQQRAANVARIEHVTPARQERRVASQLLPERAPPPPEVVEPVAETAPLARPPEPARAPRRQGELSLIGRALASLRDGEPQRALTLLDVHARRHPRGTFATERAGLRVLALCAAGRREEARRERAIFLRESARAPIAARVRAACEEEP